MAHQEKTSFIARSLVVLFLSLFCFCSPVQGQSVIISEVADPDNNFDARYIEVYNATSGSVDLSGWELRKYANGGGSPSCAYVFPTSTVLCPGATYTIAKDGTAFNSSYSCAPDGVDGCFNFNGDDALELFDGTATVDVYGVIGVDGTGEPWEYTDAIARRNSNICSGNTSWTSSEWTITDPGNTTDATPCSHLSNCGFGCSHTISSFTPTKACPDSGTTITINGSGFTNGTGTSDVQFGGISAPPSGINIVSSSEIQVTLPDSALPGSISVVTDGCTLTSCQEFMATCGSCFEIESILVDACGSPEGTNEMVRFRTGQDTLDANNLTVSWPSNSWGGVTQNSQTADSVAYLNSTIEKCGYLIEPPNFKIPPGSEVILITSYEAQVSANPFSQLNDTVYILFQNSTTTSGHFKNYPNTTGTKTLSMDFDPPGSCGDTVTYDPDSLVDQNGVHQAADGAYVEYTPDNTASFGNNGCQAIFTPLSVDLEVSASSDTVCEQDSIRLIADIQGSYDTLQWSGGSGNFTPPDNDTTWYHAGSGISGTIPIIVKVADTCQIDTVVSDTTDLEVLPLPNASISTSGPTNICPGDSVELTGSGGDSLIWSTGETTATIWVDTTTIDSLFTFNSCGMDTMTQSVALLDSFHVQQNDTICEGDSVFLAGAYQTSSGNYVDTLTTSNGCDSILTTTLAVNDTPNIDTSGITITDATCGNSDGEITGITVTGGSGTYTYEWADGSGTVVSTSTSTTDLTNQPSGNYTLTVTDDNTGCTSVGPPLTINDQNAPTVDAGADTSICIGDTVQIGGSPTATGGTSPFDHAWNNANTLDDSTLANPNAFPATATTYQVLVTDDNGCTASDNITVTVKDTFHVSDSATICTGDSILFGGNYYSATGSYTETFPAFNSCDSIVTLNLDVSTTPLVNVDIIGSTTLCSGDSVTLAGSGNGTLSWNGTTDDTITINSTGNYTLTSATSCDTADTTIQVTSASDPTVSITNAPDTLHLCPDSFYPLSASGTGGDIQWSNGVDSNTTQITSSGTYVATITNACGSASDSVLAIIREVNAEFDSDPTSGSYPLDVNFTDQSTNAASWHWEFGDGDSSNTQNPSHIFSESGDYIVSLTVSNEFGCEDSASYRFIRVDLVKDLKIPNVFSPNGDVDNEEFKVEVQNVESFQGTIFNRWGQVLFRWEDPNVGWDGHTSSGRAVAEGVYFYLIELTFKDGETMKDHGQLSLYR